MPWATLSVRAGPRPPRERRRAAADVSGNVSGDVAAGDVHPPAARSVARRLGPTPAQWRDAVVLVVVTRVLFLLIAYGAAWFLATGRGHLDTGPLVLWRQWDADLYLKIANHGYQGAATDPWAEAFFPLFPLLIRGLHLLGIPSLVAGLLISAGGSVVACAYLIVLAETDAGPGTGRRAALYLLLFPTAVFLVAPYTESLFLAGAIPAVHYARRGAWGRAGLPAAIAVGSRLAGVFVLSGLAVVLLTRRVSRWRREWKPAVAALSVASLPLVGYLGWLWAVRGTPLYFLTAQRNGWGRHLTDPWTSLTNTLSTWRGSYPTNFYAASQVEVLAALVGLALVGWALYRREWDAAAYMGPMLGVLLVSTWYYSVPRVLLTFFPAMIWLARWTGRGEGRHELVVASLAPVATLGVIVFTRGGWFF